MTNLPRIAKELNLRCPNTREHKVHEHVVLINGRAKQAEVYPSGLCRAICKGLLQQMEADRKGQFLMVHVDIKEGQKADELVREVAQIKKRYKIVEEEDNPDLETAWDDVSGAELDPKEVKRARAEEVEYVRKMKLYNKVPIEECYQKTGKAPSTVRWIDINKGDKLNPNYRSRLVAREIDTHKRDDLFAGTPPLEALKSILSMTASGNKGETIMVNDVSRAFFHAKARREVYVQLASEDQFPGEERMCGKLNYSMYGTRDAAQNWANEYAGMLINIGFTQGLASPYVFYHRERKIRTFVHGDDYVSSAQPAQLIWLKQELEKK